MRVSMDITTNTHAYLLFSANPDLVERLKSREPLYKWDRSRFYGPFPDNEIGYTEHPDRTFAAMDDILKPQLAS